LEEIFGVRSAGPQHGRTEIKSAKPVGPIDGFIGLLAGKSMKVLTIEEMNRAAAEGWAKAHERLR
jgi:hypothetical protein